MRQFLLAFRCLILTSILQTAGAQAIGGDDDPYFDTPFLQEYHEPTGPDDDEGAKEVRSIDVDQNDEVWIATAAGVYVKEPDSNHWQRIIVGEKRGPSYAVVADGHSTVWMGTWDGVYGYRHGNLHKHEAVTGPISVICRAPEGVYCLGPRGIWLYADGQWKTKPYRIAKSIRDAVADGQGGLWVATDVGLYHCRESATTLYQNERELISSYVRGLAFDDRGRLWAGGLGGVSVRAGNRRVETLTTDDGLSSAWVTSIDRSPEGVMWVGTPVGVVRYDREGRHSLRFSRRWLLDDRINDVAFDNAGNAWVATAGGVSAIKRRRMTLAAKADYFYRVLMERHIRPPWIAGHCRLQTPGDLSSWQPEDDDNDGEYTGLYLAMESLRYAVTRNPDARAKAAKAFSFLTFLQEVTDTEGFFARTVVPADWTEVHDRNRTYTDRQAAEALVRDPRYKPVETRWRPSRDGQWLWKGDTSSDEMCGHMMGYFYYYELAADEKQRRAISRHVQRIMDYLIRHDYNLVDVDGRPTRWAVWSPAQLNREPDWAPERCLNSFELLTFLKFAHHITGNQTYQDEYLRLIREEHYLENALQMNRKNPAWFIYFDVSLAGYLFPILMKYETDPQLKARYEQLIDEWFARQIRDECPLHNFIYGWARNRRREMAASIRFLVDTPLDLVDWHIDHTKREDIRIVRHPTLEERQTHVLVPPAIRATVRWDRNPWAAVGGHPLREREPVFWLLPYWLGRYTGAILE
jgi:streptogramin lyase